MWYLPCVCLSMCGPLLAPLLGYGAVLLLVATCTLYRKWVLTHNLTMLCRFAFVLYCGSENIT